MAKSAGTSASAKRPITADDVRWADVILVMEEKHKSRITAEFGRLLTGKRIVVLDIPDEYEAMAPELMELVEETVAAVLEL